MNKIQVSKRGFTLIELLIVIAIVAVLAVAVVLVLNPAELIRQGRDSTRISDFGVVLAAVSYMMSVSSTPAIANEGPVCNLATGLLCIPTGGTTASNPFNGGTMQYITSRTVNGSGWVGVRLDGVTPGPPLANLPIDPVNANGSSTYFYKGSNTNLVFEINATLESTKFSGLMTSDGGDRSSLYEVGSDPNLDM